MTAPAIVGPESDRLLRTLAVLEAEALTGVPGPVPTLSITTLPCTSCPYDDRQTLADDVARTPLGRHMPLVPQPQATLTAFACELLDLRQFLAVGSAVAAGARVLRTRAIAVADLSDAHPLAVLSAPALYSEPTGAEPWTLPVSTQILGPTGIREWRIVGHRNGIPWTGLTERYVALRDEAVRGLL
ncbi:MULTISPECIES: hypothetical protein [unclassified Streptomyces]|uniref:hypothetical protein n=1 Tax=unclassified Streptomyces TaxID=2593676 RepID=UPI0037959D42